MSGRNSLTSMMIAWMVWVLAAAALSTCLQAAEPPIPAPAEPLRLAQRDEERGDVRVPEVRGRHVTQAEAVILRAGLSPGQMTQQDSDSPEGTVLRQVPAAGQQVQRGTPVRLWLARPYAPPRVPSVIGRPIWEAERILQEANLRLREGDRERSDQPGDTVVRQEPGPGGFRPPNAVVTVWLADGRPSHQARVPSVIGHPVREAQRILREADLRLRQGGRERSDQPEGTVIRQEPDPRGFRPPDAVVTVWLAAPELVTVPNLVGESLETATALLGRALRLGQQSMRPSQTPEGLILEQRPPAGAKLPTGGTVDAVISSGGLMRVPRVVGGNQIAAVVQLDASDLRVGRVVTEESQERPGTVTRQQPPEGSLAPRRTGVDIWVAVRAADGKRPPPLWSWLIGGGAALLGAAGWWWSRRPGPASGTGSGKGSGTGLKPGPAPRATSASEPQVRVHIGEVESRAPRPLPLDPRIPEIAIRARLLRGDIEITAEDIVVGEERRNT